MKIISSMATRRLLRELVADAESVGFPPTDVESVGGVVAARRVAAGEPVDLVILSAPAIDELAATGHVDSSSVVPLVVSPTAVAVAGHGAESVVESTAAAEDAGHLRAMLRAVDTIGYSTGPSGTALLDLIDSWGLGDDLRPRLRRAEPGRPVAAMIADGEVEIGFQQLCELSDHPGVRVLGVLPPDCAVDTTFSGAVAGNASDPETASAVLTFFASPSVARIVAECSFSRP